MSWHELRRGDAFVGRWARRSRPRHGHLKRSLCARRRRLLGCRRLTAPPPPWWLRRRRLGVFGHRVVFGDFSAAFLDEVPRAAPLWGFRGPARPPRAWSSRRNRRWPSPPWPVVETFLVPALRTAPSSSVWAARCGTACRRPPGLSSPNRRGTSSRTRRQSPPRSRVRRRYGAGARRRLRLVARLPLLMLHRVARDQARALAVDLRPRRAPPNARFDGRDAHLFLARGRPLLSKSSRLGSSEGEHARRMKASPLGASLVGGARRGLAELPVPSGRRHRLGRFVVRAAPTEHAADREWTRRAGTIVMQDGQIGRHGVLADARVGPDRAQPLPRLRGLRVRLLGHDGVRAGLPVRAAAHVPFADAVRRVGPRLRSWFGGKWHLGSFYNDSEAYGGVTSSPLFHGVERMNATVEVAPTATANWQCDAAWNASGVEFGHYGAPNHCDGGPNPGGAALPDGCCFNYWRRTRPRRRRRVEPDGAERRRRCGVRRVRVPRRLPRRARAGRARFAAQLSFHNCHIPFIGQPASRAACARACCARPTTGAARRAPTFSDAQLDFFACLNELDAAVGAVLDRLDALGRYEDTFVWFTTDNGARGELRAGRVLRRRPLRGRADRRGPAARPQARPVGGRPPRADGRLVARGRRRAEARARELLARDDRLPRDRHGRARRRPPGGAAGLGVRRALGLADPARRRVARRARGRLGAYDNWPYDTRRGYGYRSGSWKLLVGSTSCGSANCSVPMLFDLASDLGETRDLAAARARRARGDGSNVSGLGRHGRRGAEVARPSARPVNEQSARARGARAAARCASSPP